MRKGVLALVLVAPLARAEPPVVIARLPTNATHDRIVDAACSVHLANVDVSVDDRRCAFGFVAPGSEPLFIRTGQGIVTFEGHIDPELVRVARTRVDHALSRDYHANTWVVSTWAPRSPALRDTGVLVAVLGGFGVAALPCLGIAALLVAQASLCFKPDRTGCGGDASPLTLAMGVDALAAGSVVALGLTGFYVGRTKVALVPSGVRVTF